MGRGAVLCPNHSVELPKCRAWCESEAASCLPAFLLLRVYRRRREARRSSGHPRGLRPGCFDCVLVCGGVRVLIAVARIGAVRGESQERTGSLRAIHRLSLFVWVKQGPTRPVRRCESVCRSFCQPNVASKGGCEWLLIPMRQRASFLGSLLTSDWLGEQRVLSTALWTLVTLVCVARWMWASGAI